MTVIMLLLDRPREYEIAPCPAALDSVGLAADDPSDGQEQGWTSV